MQHKTMRYVYVCLKRKTKKNKLLLFDCITNFEICVVVPIEMNRRLKMDFESMYYRYDL